MLFILSFSVDIPPCLSWSLDKQLKQKLKQSSFLPSLLHLSQLNCPWQITSDFQFSQSCILSYLTFVSVSSFVLEFHCFFSFPIPDSYSSDYSFKRSLYALDNIPNAPSHSWSYSQNNTKNFLMRNVFLLPTVDNNKVLSLFLAEIHVRLSDKVLTLKKKKKPSVIVRGSQLNSFAIVFPRLIYT